MRETVRRDVKPQQYSARIFQQNDLEYSIITLLHITATTKNALYVVWSSSIILSTLIYPFRFGSLLKIHKSQITGLRVSQKAGKAYSLNVLGLTFARFRIVSLIKGDGKIVATVQIFNDAVTKTVEDTLLKKNLIPSLKHKMKLYYEFKMKHDDSQVKKQLLQAEKSINKLLFRCIQELDLPIVEKLKFLQMDRHDTKAEFLLQYLTQKVENVKMVIDLEQKVRNDMGKSMTISNKPSQNSSSVFGLGRNRGPSEVQEIQEKMAKRNIPEHVKEEIRKEMKRMGGQMQQNVALKYVETLLDIPWNNSSEEVRDIEVAKKVLNQDHIGLKDVKERILQFLAVRFRNGNSRGSIVCLHGPPGVGKTSIVKSIARALGKSYTRISLGGMNDQSELRGHRRTYLAAMPGMIIRALISARSNNPVILLDEIEKMGQSYKGNPQHALLQILDPSQNSSFVDHYVQIPVDLSKVLFICTANSLEMSTPLINRLELIKLPGYNAREKLQIMEAHLLPIQLKQNGVQGLVEFKPDALQEIVKHSEELGVRNLQRNLAKICRRVALKGQKEIITRDIILEVLGPRRESIRWEGIGVVNGMAWTPFGGKVLIVQAVAFPSSAPKIQVTGQLGNVMRESVTIALSWIRAHQYEFQSPKLAIQKPKLSERIQQLSKNGIHIHFPEGATKKDGPSAGVTIATCLISLILQMPVRSHLSMTGEITLTGQVLPVGGIRQKCTAAWNQGIRQQGRMFGVLGLIQLQEYYKQLQMS